MKTIYLVLAAAAAVHLAVATSTSSPSATVRKLQASGTLRLAQGTAPGVGRLEVFERGQWGTVCDDSFGTNEGTVACRLLGYNNYVADSNGGSLISVRTSSTAVTPATNECAVPILWDDVQCNAPIFPGVPNCNFRSGAWGSENCSPSENVVLGCTNSLTGRLTGTPSTTRLSNCIPGSTRFRLAGGTSTYGRLEVSYDGTCSQSLAQVMNAGCTTPVGSIWGSVCDDGFSNFDANAVCQTLGFAGATFNSNQASTSGTASTTTRSFYPVTAQASSSTNIWLDNVDCPTSALTATQGSYSSLCRHNGIGVDNCVHSEDVTLACSNNATYPEADVPSGTTSPSTNGGTSGGPSTGGTTGGSSGDTGNSDLGTTLGTVIPIIFVFCIASFIFRTVMARRRAQAAAQSAASSNPAHSSALSGGSVARQKMVLAMTGGGTTTSASMQPAAQPQVHPPAVPNAYMTPGAPPGSGVGASTYASPTPYPGATPYPGSAAGYPAPGAAPAAPAYPGAAPPAYPGAAPGMGGYPGAPPAMGAYPGAPPGPAAYPGAPPPAVGGYPGAPTQNQAYPSAPPNFNAPPAY